MMKNKLLLSLIFFVVFLNGVFALSNESIFANESLNIAKENVQIMQERGIPVERVNELYLDAHQLYEAQTALEESGKVANYELIIKYCKEVSDIKDNSISARDQLDVFIDTYNSVSENTNLSEMQQEYDAIIKSFEEERFEDTLTLIEEGYNRMSEVESSQTGVRLFYDATTKSLRKWFLQNWRNLVIGFLVFLFIYFISYKAMKRYSIRKEIKRLNLKKAALDNLIKKIQHQYFEQNNISETEYNVKVERFKEMIRDVDRQIPLLNERLAKLNYRKSTPSENPMSAENMTNKKTVNNNVKNNKKSRKKKR